MRINTKRGVGPAVRWLATGIRFAATGYAAYADVTWLRYGYVKRTANGLDADPQLDRFIPVYEVVERRHAQIAAPAELALSTTCDMDLQQSAIIRAISNRRALTLRSKPAKKALSRTLLVQMKALGWGVLADLPDREIVFGVATRPWESDVVFRALSSEEFAAFNEPGHVKIVWTLRADPVGPAKSVFHTETRVATTDPTARRKFRRYWAFFSPGIILIRRILLRLLKAEAERRAPSAQSKLHQW